MCSAAFGIFSLIHEMSRNTPPCGLPRPAFTSRMMQRATWSRVSKFRRTLARFCRPACSASLLRDRSRSAIFVIVGNVVEHEPLAVLVAQHAAFAAHAFGHEQSHDARRPDHARRMKLDEFHVQQFRARVIRQRNAVARAFPGIARDFVGAAQTAGGKARRLSP